MYRASGRAGIEKPASFREKLNFTGKARTEKGRVKIMEDQQRGMALKFVMKTVTG